MGHSENIKGNKKKARKPPLLADGDSIDIIKEKVHKTKDWPARETKKVIIKAKMVDPPKVCYPKEKESESQSVSWSQRRFLLHPNSIYATQTNISGSELDAPKYCIYLTPAGSNAQDF